VKEAFEPGVLNLELHEAQSLALNAPCEETLYGGAAGGGKSHLIRAALITWCLAVRGLQCFLFRRTYPELKMNHLEGPTSFYNLLAPLIQTGHARVVEKEVRFWNGSMIKLCHLQHAKDLANYQGAEIHVLAMDEATHFTKGEYAYLRGRMRVIGIKIPDSCPWIFPRSILGTNPGGVGHHHCKQGWVKHGPYRIHRASKEDGGMRRVYIPAKVADNPTLLEEDPTYLDRLEGLGDATLVRSLKDGDWNVVAGAMYGEIWREDRHLVDPFAIPPDWQIWIGGDDGYASPSGIYWVTQDPKRKTYYVLREIYEAKLHPDQMAKRMASIHFRIPIRGTKLDSPPVNNELPICGNYDSAAFADKGEGRKKGRGNQIRAELQKNNWGTISPTDKWQGSRVHGAQALHSILDVNPHDPSGMPGLRVFRGCCPELVRTLPALGRDKNNPEDVDTDEEDHAYDGLRYALQWRDKRLKKRGVSGT